MKTQPRETVITKQINKCNFTNKDNSRLTTLQLISKAKLSEQGYFLGRKATRAKDKNNMIMSQFQTDKQI